jgi:hypothetical protein
MMASPARRALSGTALKVVDRIMVEQQRHGGADNGALPVTYDDFVAHGIRRSSIRQALAEAIALGFVERTKEGRRPYGVGRGAPAEYRLTWLPLPDGTPASDRWRSFTTVAEAQAAADAAREAAQEASSRTPREGRSEGDVRPGRRLIPVDELTGARRVGSRPR